jgi:hypothetical protein
LKLRDQRISVPQPSIGPENDIPLPSILASHRMAVDKEGIAHSITRHGFVSLNHLKIAGHVHRVASNSLKLIEPLDLRFPSASFAAPQTIATKQSGNIRWPLPQDSICAVPCGGGNPNEEKSRVSILINKIIA